MAMPGAGISVSLATSLHLNHAEMTLEHEPGDDIPVQAFVPVGLASLKAFADSRSLNADIQIFEINSLIRKGLIPNDANFYGHLADVIANPGDHFVGLMTDADSLHHTILMALAVKQRSPDTHVCLGGPAASPLATPLLSTFDCIDSVVRGEGEITFTELLEHLELGKVPDDVPGLTWRAPDGAVVQNERRTVIEDLDQLPIPSFAAAGCGADAAMYLDVGRGCPFKCQFCATAPYWDRRFRMKSVDRIIEEMTLQRDMFGRHHLNFSHDIFTCNRTWTRRFCRRLTEAGLGVTWSCSTRTDVIDAEVLQLMAEAGCVEIYYGIETGSATMQRIIQKHLDLERARSIVAATASAGIRPVTGFIVGYPMETPETMRDTLRCFFDFLDVGQGRAHLFPLCPFDQAPMHKANHRVNRRAATFEAPLVATEAARAEAVVGAHPHLFRGLYRFETPDVRPELVDACEEVSSRLVGLKTLWPHVLRHYPSALDWLERWIGWIGSRNEGRPAGRALRHHGEAVDLLDFVGDELQRLGQAGSAVSELVRYERAKLRASERLHPVAVPDPPEREFTLDLDAVVARVGEMLVERFDADLRSYLRPRRPETSTPFARSLAGEPDERHVVLIKRPSGDLDTFQVGAAHAAVLERLARPRRIRDVLSDDPTADLASELAPVKDLAASGLLVELDRRARREGGSLPGSRGEHDLQVRCATFGRAYTFYNRQFLDHLNPLMTEYLQRQEMMFVATADAGGECDCSFRGGPPGFVRVLDPRTLAYPEYRGNGVMASLGNITENRHVGLLFADFFDSTVGLHVNGTAEIVENADFERRFGVTPINNGDGSPRAERWVVVRVEEAYLHCSKHIPALAKRSKSIRWGTDDAALKGGDYFRAQTLRY